MPNICARTLFLALVLFATPAISSMVFTFRSPESPTDRRFDYDNALFELALKKTIAEYGPYELRPSGLMNFSRAAATAAANKRPNFFFKQSFSPNLVNDNLSLVPFPVDLGIVSYRVCFVSEQTKKQLQQIESIEGLKRFSHGQGIGWSDVTILRANGMTVIEAPSYEGLFMMVAKNRFDLFCRGANELLAEYEAHKHIDNFTYDTSMAIFYPLPRFFYTHRDNKQAIERVHKGLLAAYQDGSLLKLWSKHYGDSVKYVKLHERQIYRIDNPNVKGLEFNFQKYFIDPIQAIH